MVSSLRSLLSRVIDYAGMFPPAELPVGQALRNYAEYRGGEHSWALSRLVIGASTLEQIDLKASEFAAEAGAPWHLAVIGRGGEELISCLKVLQQEMRAISTFNQRNEGVASVDVIEMRMPPAVMESGSDGVLELVERSSEAIATGATGMIPFFEIPYGARGPEELFGTLSALSKFNTQWAGPRYHAVGAKIRTGGSSAEAFPSTRQLAFFVGACSKLHLPFKATAGLHHPLRQRDESIGAEVHGFVNVFVGVVLADALKINLQTLIKVLESDQADDFLFKEDGLSWHGRDVTLEQIATARKDVGISYGSCSFTDPIEGLKSMNWL